MSKQPVHWAQHKESGSYYGMWIMLWAYRLGGRPLFSILLYPVMLYFFIFNRTARQASIGFLQRVYRQHSPALPAPPGLRHSFSHFMSFGFAILDKLAVWFGSIEVKQVMFPNREWLRERIREGKGGVILASHFGNVELCRYLSKQTPELKLNILVHTHHAKKFNEVLDKLQTTTQINFIQVTEVGPETAMLLKQKIEAGEFLAIVGDRIPVESNHRINRVDFLGEPAGFPQGPFILAALLKCPVYTLFCYRTKTAYQVDVAIFAESLRLQRRSRSNDLHDYIEQYAQVLQDYALRYPYQWFNFYDFWHKN